MSTVRVTVGGVLQLLVAVTLGLMFFERAVDVEILKPYRITGLLLVVVVILSGRLRTPYMFKIYVGLLAYMLFLGLLYTLSGHGNIKILANDLSVVMVNIAIGLAIYSVARRDGIGPLSDWVLWGSTLVSALYVLQDPQNALGEGAEVRIIGFVKNPAFGAFGYAAAVIFLASRETWRRSNTRTYLLLVMIVLCYLAVLAGGSRIGVLLYGFGVFIALNSLVARWHIGRMGRAFVYTLLVCGVVVPLGISAYLNSITHTRVERKMEQTDARYYLAKSGLSVAADSYYLGIGFGQYRAIHRSVFPGGRTFTEKILAGRSMSLHDEFLQTLVEGGVIGLSMFLWFWTKLFRIVAHSYSLQFRNLLRFVFIGGLFLAAFHSIGDALPFWSFLAIALALDYRSGMQEGQGKAPLARGSSMESQLPMRTL